MVGLQRGSERIGFGVCSPLCNECISSAKAVNVSDLKFLSLQGREVTPSASRLLPAVHSSTAHPPPSTCEATKEAMSGACIRLHSPRCMNQLASMTALRTWSMPLHVPNSCKDV